MCPKLRATGSASVDRDVSGSGVDVDLAEFVVGFQSKAVDAASKKCLYVVTGTYMSIWSCDQVELGTKKSTATGPEMIAACARMIRSNVSTSFANGLT